MAMELDQAICLVEHKITVFGQITIFACVILPNSGSLKR